jgi:hypothetical protein
VGGFGRFGERAREVAASGQEWRRNGRKVECQLGWVSTWLDQRRTEVREPARSCRARTGEGERGSNGRRRLSGRDSIERGVREIARQERCEHEQRRWASGRAVCSRVAEGRANGRAGQKETAEDGTSTEQDRSRGSQGHRKTVQEQGLQRTSAQHRTGALLFARTTVKHKITPIPGSLSVGSHFLPAP